MILIALINTSSHSFANTFEQRDTIIDINSTLQLEFVFETIECGINIFSHPSNSDISQLNSTTHLIRQFIHILPQMILLALIL